MFNQFTYFRHYFRKLNHILNANKNQKINGIKIAHRVIREMAETHNSRRTSLSAFNQQNNPVIIKLNKSKLHKTK